MYLSCIRRKACCIRFTAKVVYTPNVSKLRYRQTRYIQLPSTHPFPPFTFLPVDVFFVPPTSLQCSRRISSSMWRAGTGRTFERGITSRTTRKLRLETPLGPRSDAASACNNSFLSVLMRVAFGGGTQAVNDNAAHLKQIMIYLCICVQ